MGLRLFFSVAGIVIAMQASGQWTNHFHNGMYEGVDFADNTTCYGAGFSGAPGNPGIIEKSTDGGITFANLLTDANKAYNDVDFVSADTGVACGTALGSALFSRTTDGGSSWTHVVIANGQSVHRIEFLDDNNAFAGGGMSSTEIWRSTDGGVTWSLIYDPPNSEPVVDISFVDTLNGFYATGGALGTGTVYKTTDGGFTWTPCGPITPQGITAVHFKTPQQGIATGNNGSIYRTFNAGATWSICANADPNNSFYNDIHFVNGSFGFICGYYGASVIILRTTNGGANWAVSYNAAVPLMLFSLTSVQNTVVCAGQDHLRTTNLGGSLSNYVTGFISGYDTLCPGDSATIRLDFTGTPPWHFTTAPATQSFSGINTTPFFFNVAPAAATNYTIGTFGDAIVSSSIYKSGQANANVALPPSAGTYGGTTICSGDTAYMPIGFTGCGPFTVTYTDGTSNFVLNNVNGPAAVIPVAPTVPTTYSIVSVLAVNGNPGAVNGTFSVQIGNVTASLSGSATICAGDTIILPLTLSGAFPMTVNISDGSNTLQFANITSPLDLVLMPGVSANYSLVSVTNSCGTVPGSGSCSVAVLPSAAAPLLLSSNSVGPSEIFLSWTDISGNETAFVVQRSNSAAGPFTDIVSLPPNTTSYLDTGLTVNTRYYYRIRTECASVCEKYTGVVSDSVRPALWFSPGFNTGPPLAGALEVAWTDFNNDGYDDLLHKYTVHLNNGNGTFTPLNFAVNGPSYYSAIGDYNNDGYADIFLAHSSLGQKLLLNDSGTAFIDITVSAGIVPSTYGNLAMAIDEDNDGFLDIVYTDNAGAIVLLHNNGDSTFALQTGCAICYADEIPCSVIDIDNDHDLDFMTRTSREVILHRKNGASYSSEQIFITQSSTRYVVAASFCDITGDGAPEMSVAADMTNPLTPLFLNDGNGFFTQVTPPGILPPHNSRDATFADVMNDGWPDRLYLDYGTDNNLYAMDSLTETEIFNTYVTSFNNMNICSAWTDADRDGDQDVFMHGNDVSEVQTLFLNDGNYSGGFFQVQCVGVISNRMAYGARVAVKSTINGISRWQYRHIQPQTGRGMSSPVAHFGMGDAAVIDSVIIHWPSGIVTHAVNVPVNQRTVMYELLPVCALLPDSILATGISSASVSVVWPNPCTTPLFQVIQRAPAFAGPYVIEDTVASNTFQYTSTGLQPQTIYYYKIDLHYPGGIVITSFVDSALTLTSCNALAVLNASDTSICQGQFSHLTAPSGYSYQWFLNGQPIANATSDFFDAQTGGDYSYEMLAPGGCIAYSPTVTIIYHPLQAAYVSNLGSDTVCSSQPTQITWNYPVAMSVNWMYQFAPTGITTNTITVAQGGVYSFFGTDANGCPVNSAPYTIYSFGTAALLTTGPYAICPSDQQLLDAVNVPGMNYQWCYNSSPVPGATSHQYNASQSGNYYLICTSSTGCTDTTATISVSHHIVDSTVTFLVPDTFLCADDSWMNLSALPAGGYFSGLGVSQNVFYPDQVTPGPVTLYYHVNDSNGCPITQPLNIVVDPCTGIDEAPASWSVSVVQNPFAHTLTINSETTAPFAIYNVAGQLVLCGNLKPGTNVIETDALSGGMYLLRVEVLERVVSLKLVKD